MMYDASSACGRPCGVQSSLVWSSLAKHVCGFEKLARLANFSGRTCSVNPAAGSTRSACRTERAKHIERIDHCRHSSDIYALLYVCRRLLAPTATPSCEMDAWMDFRSLAGPRFAPSSRTRSTTEPDQTRPEKDTRVRDAVTATYRPG